MSKVASTSRVGTSSARRPGFLCELLGGRYGDDVHLYRAISQQSPDEMADKVADYRAEGYRRFQLKVGGDPDVDIARIRAVADRLSPGDRLVADANTGWVQHEAVRVAKAVRDIDVYIEQPCRRTSSASPYADKFRIHSYSTRTSTTLEFSYGRRRTARWTSST